MKLAMNNVDDIKVSNAKGMSKNNPVSKWVNVFVRPMDRLLKGEINDQNCASVRFSFR